MSCKKRKMEDGAATGAASVTEAEVAPPMEVEAGGTPLATDVEMPQSAATTTEGDAEAEADSPSAAEPLSEEEVAQMVSDLPTTVSVLQRLNTHLDVCRSKPFHALRKEVLRLAAQLQGIHFTGETKDAAQKRQYRRREKGERLARELKQKTEDAKYINSVALRNSRIQALNALVEPEGWGEKKGDNLLMPGESAKLLMPPTAAEDASASPDSALVPSASPLPSASPAPTSTIPSEAVLAAAAGPQSYTYPTIAPASELAELVSASTSTGSITSKPYVRTPGAAAAATTAVVATSSEPKSSVQIPSLPVIEDEIDPKTLSKTQLKKAQANSGRSQKKAMFSQEGIHVNQEVLQENIKKEQEAKEETKKTFIKTESVPMDTTANAAASSSNPDVAAAAAASLESDPVSGSINGQAEFGPVLNNPRSCYCCKARFYQLHFFYSEFCPPCARLNYAKRNQLADLRGKVILLTGSRVKIGLRCGLRLLRCGATLIATSRFPHDTAKRYSEEKDFDTWKSRLHIFGLDLRDLKSVVKLAEILSERYDRLDAIVNNAAQTVRRPPMYYRHLLPIECLKPEEMPAEWRDIVHGDFHEIAGRQKLQEAGAKEAKRLSEESAAAATISSGVVVEEISADHTEPASAAPAAAAAEPPATPLSPIADVTVESGGVIDAFHRAEDINAALLTTSNRAAALSQLSVLPGDQHQDSALFPAGCFDVTGQQLDLRSVNSWKLTLEQVDPSELVECFAINALSPFILNSRLKGLMLKGGMHPQLGVQTTDKYIINVSAMEGKFYRHKSAHHPHTNAAKAALNMMTRTSAQDYAKDRIYMNSVDTGWINDENPYETAKRLYEKHNFQTPIDEEDAMARILDPILSGVNTGINCFGKFFKDYHETEW